MKVMPHQSVEIEWRRHAGVNLVIGHFRFDADGGGDFARGLRGAFQRAAFGHVQDDLELALVVERQHLHLHPAERRPVAIASSSSARSSREKASASAAARSAAP